ncbi:MAG TPA: polysaccharide deacetylase family protein [Candidatus Limnocylindrales bacterium]
MRPPAPIASLDPFRRSRRRQALRLFTGLVTILVVVALVHASIPLLSAGGSTAPRATANAQVVAAQTAGLASSVPERLAVRRPDPGPALGTAILVAAPQVRLGPPATVVYRVRTTQKVIALTFDDGWNVKAGRAILDTLVRLHVKATFFVNAIYVHRDPDLWRDIAAAGFPIGDHTFDHRNLTTLPYGLAMADVQKDESVFHRLTGYTLAPILRPPYGARNRTVDAAALAAGYPTEILWDTVSGDTTAGVADRQLVANATAGRPGSIVLLHVGPASTPRILAAVIAAYRARGFSFVTIPELLALRAGA